MRHTTVQLYGTQPKMPKGELKKPMADEFKVTEWISQKYLTMEMFLLEHCQYFALQNYSPTLLTEEWQYSSFLVFF